MTRASRPRLTRPNGFARCQVSVWDFSSSCHALPPLAGPGRCLAKSLGQKAAGVPTVVFGPGSIDQAHTCDEWIDVAEVEIAAAALVAAMA